MTKGNVLTFFLGILFCIATGFFVKSKTALTLENAAVIPASSNQPKSIRMKVTAYCPCEKCCGKYADGKTATNKDALKTLGVAADPKLLPYSTKLEIPGIGIREVDDTGGAMRQNGKKGIFHIDLRFHNHQEAKEFGVKWLDVKILSPVT